MEITDKVVIIAGASGLLGSRLCSFYKKKGYKVIATYRKNQPEIFDSKYNVDLTVKTEIEEIEDPVSLIINCAGYINIEGNELFPERSWLENVVIPHNLSEFSKMKGAKFVHISTDHFESSKKAPRYEDENFSVVNKYGYSKLEAEKMVSKSNSNALIVRTNFFGRSISGSTSLLDWVLTQIEDENEIKGFTDVFFNPVSINFLIKSIDTLLARDSKGIYNVASRQVISKFDFIEFIYNILNKDCGNIKQTSIDNNQKLAMRPKYMALDATKFESDTEQKVPNILDMLKNELMVI